MSIRKSDLNYAGRAAFLISLLLLVPFASGAEINPERLVFPLEEVSGFDIALNFGHVCPCRGEPEPNVVYPAFVSAKPLYGVMRVDMEFANLRSGTPYAFALDESGGTGTGYDRLYLDRNRDGRLSDETPIAPLPELPAGLWFRAKSVTPPVWFGPVTFSSTDARGTHALETLPRLRLDNQGATLSFAATKARKGEIAIGPHRFRVTIVNGYPLGTRWDRPGTTMRLEAQGGDIRIPSWAGSNWLMALHWIDGRYWRFAMTPAGDRLFVEPCPDAAGTLQAEMRAAFLRTTTLSGVLLSADTAVPVGRRDQHGNYRPASRCEVPAGDYTLADLEVRHGPLSFNLSLNRFADGTPDSPAAGPTPCLHIRSDRPCVLDLARKASLRFTTLDPGTRLKLGQELRVQVALVEPGTGLAIGNLRRLPQEEASPVALALIGALMVGPVGGWLAAGKKRQQYRSLPLFSGIGLLILGGYLGGLCLMNALLHSDLRHGDKYENLTPQVTITRVNGAQVTGGPMSVGSCTYAWRVPEDFQIHGNEETLTIKVIYDTRELYGTVTAQRNVTVHRHSTD